LRKENGTSGVMRKPSNTKSKGQSVFIRDKELAQAP